LLAYAAVSVAQLAPVVTPAPAGPPGLSGGWRRVSGVRTCWAGSPR
jgi:hypothetical protein